MKFIIETSAPLWWRRFCWRMTPARLLASVFLFAIVAFMLLPVVLLIGAGSGG